MTWIKNIFAGLEIFIGNYTYHYGTATNIILIFLFLLLLIIGLIKANMLPKMEKRRSEDLGKNADSGTVKSACEALSKMISFASVPGDVGAMTSLVEFLKVNYSDVFKTIQCVTLPSQSLLLCWKAPLKPVSNPVLLCGHLDVMPSVGKWQYPAFSGADDGQSIWGRGSLEGKSIVIAQLEGIRQLISEGYVPQRDIYFAYSTDSQTGGKEGARRIAEIFEKKKLKFDFVLDGGAMVTSAHLGNKLFPAALVGVAEKASAELVITARGQGGNAATPRRHTALGTLAEAICRIENAPMKRHLLPCVVRTLKMSSAAMNGWQRFVVANSRVLKPFVYSAFKNNMGIQALFHTTFSAIEANGSPVAGILPEQAEARINVRILQRDSLKKVEHHVKSLVGDLPVSVELCGEEQPSQVTAVDSISFDLLKNTISKHFDGVPVIPTLLSQVTDTKHYALLSDNLFRFSPFVINKNQAAGIHWVDEHINKQNLGVAVDFYKSIMSAL